MESSGQGVYVCGLSLVRGASEMSGDSPYFWRDVDVDGAALRKRLLDALIDIDGPGFLRSPPRIISEKDFESGVVFYKATFRFTPYSYIERHDPRPSRVPWRFK